MVALTQAVLPQMRQQRRGAIVQLSDMGGQMSFAEFSAYSATKLVGADGVDAVASYLDAVRADIDGWETAGTGHSARHRQDVVAPAHRRGGRDHRSSWCRWAIGDAG